MKIEGRTNIAERFNFIMKKALETIGSHKSSEKERLTKAEQQNQQDYRKLQVQLAQNQQKQALEQLNEQSLKSVMDGLKKEEHTIRKNITDLKTSLPPEQWAVVITPSEAYFSQDVLYTDNTTILWLYGELTYLKGDVLFLEYYSYNRLTGQTTTLYKSALMMDQLDAVVLQIRDQLKEDLLGHPWAILKLTDTPRDAVIYLNNEKITSLATLSLLPPDSYQVRVEKQGFYSYEQTINLQAYETKNLTVTLAAKPNSFYTITTEPAGALVYLDGNYAGQTPLALESGQNQIINIEKDGFGTIYYNLSEEQNVFFILRKDVATDNKKERRWFYGTFSVFIVSLAAPIVLFNFRQDNLERSYAQKNAGDYDGARASERRAKNYTIAMGSTIGLSAAFLGISLSRLYYYIKASDQSVKNSEKS